MSVNPVWRQFINKCMIVSLLAAPAAASASVVSLQTSLGEIDIELFDAAAPITVANFLSYVNSGAYDGSFFHRSASLNGDPNAAVNIIQGGGFAVSGNTLVSVPTGSPIQNEFSPTRSNVRGTIAMAKTSDPNSATSQWYFNVTNNAVALDDTSNSGGFTVFGQVLGEGMTVVDAIAALPRNSSLGGVFSTLPVRGTVSGGLTVDNLVFVNSASVVPVPAAVWLFGSAVAGLGVFGRRRAA